MALWDFFKNRNNETIPQIQGVYQDVPTQTPEWNNTMAQRMASGNVQDNDSLKLIDRIRNGVNLFDKYENPTNEANTVTTDENGDTVLNSTVGNPVLTRKGFLNDVSRGFKENLNNGFKLENWQNGENKGFGTRLGEALGTAGRVLNSPLGRGLLTAGIVRATGGDGLDAITYGGQAAALNQQNVMNDRMYRKALQDYGYDTSNMGGYIDKDTFNSIANTGVKMQNSMYQNALRKLQIEKQQILNSNLPELQKAKLIQENAKAQYAVQMQEAKINAYNNGMALGWANYGLRADKADRDAKQQDLENQATQELIDSMNGGGNSTPAKQNNNSGGKTKSGVKYKVVG